MMEYDTDLDIDRIIQIVDANTERVAKCGSWPSYIDRKTLTQRIPSNHVSKAPGFDAGLACALDLIPRSKQRLAAILHANYSREAVEQIREEAIRNDPNTETTWWLAACSVCKEGVEGAGQFREQIKEFEELTKNDKERLARAKSEYAKIITSFEIRDGVPYGEGDGCIQGAYVAGYPFGTMYAKQYDAYFIGTYIESLGLEDFKWSREVDGEGRSKSGPVFGSKQFVKCANAVEYKQALDIARARLFE